MNLAPIADAVVIAAAGAVGTLAAAVIPMLPRLFRWLLVSINGADNTLLRAAIGTAAQAALKSIQGGMRTEAAIGGMVDYVKDNLPGAIGRLKVPSDTLVAMCVAELARVVAGQR